VYEVDPPGDGQHPLDQVQEILATGVGVAGVQAEADVVPVESVPEPGQRVQPAGHREVSAGGVLDQDGQRRGHPLEGLAPVLHTHGRVIARADMAAVHDQPAGADRRRCLGVLVQDLPARDADLVVRRRDVDDVGRVHVEREAAVPQLL